MVAPRLGSFSNWIRYGMTPGFIYPSSPYPDAPVLSLGSWELLLAGPLVAHDFV